MSAPIIIDRRLNPSRKNLVNRRRFMERFRSRIRDAAREQIGKRGITDGGDQEVSISGDGIDEPRFAHGNDSGEWDHVIPGNQDYVSGDTIDKPKGGQGQGRGRTGSRGETGEDEFTFLLSYDEYLDLIFDDLELPDLIKSSEKSIMSHQLRRAGFTTSGVPSNLNVERTAVAGLARRISLRSPKLARIRELEELLLIEQDEQEKLKIIEEIQTLKIRANAVSFLDSVDLRYNNFTKQPRPITQAVMFCIMDVSYSMGEQEKIIAKKFFLLLHLFLKRRYKNIDVVFIRHHEEAEECDEETFFASRLSGGTVVSTAFDLTSSIIKQRYPIDDWNVYLAQASDGDNVSDDQTEVIRLLGGIMPVVQFMAYIEITRHDVDLFHAHRSNLWTTLELVKDEHQQISMEMIHNESDVVAVFRRFFGKNRKT